MNDSYVRLIFPISSFIQIKLFLIKASIALLTHLFGVTLSIGRIPVFVCVRDFCDMIQVVQTTFLLSDFLALLDVRKALLRIEIMQVHAHCICISLQHREKPFLLCRRILVR